MAKHLLAMKTEVHSAVESAKREVHWNTVEQTLIDMFRECCEVTDEGAQHSSYQFITYVLTLMVAAGTLVSILEISFYKCSRWDAFMDAMARSIAIKSNFLESITMKGLDRAADVAGCVMPCNSHDHRRSLSPRQRTNSDSESNFSDEDERAEQTRLKMETEKGRRDGSCRCNNPEEIDGKRGMKKYQSTKSSNDDDRNILDVFSTHASNSLKEAYEHCRKMTRDEKGNLKVNRLLTYRFKEAID